MVSLQKRMKTIKIQHLLENNITTENLTTLRDYIIDSCKNGLLSKVFEGLLLEGIVGTEKTLITCSLSEYLAEHLLDNIRFELINNSQFLKLKYAIHKLYFLQDTLKVREQNISVKNLVFNVISEIIYANPQECGFVIDGLNLKYVGKL